MREYIIRDIKFIFGKDIKATANSPKQAVEKAIGKKVMRHNYGDIVVYGYGYSNGSACIKSYVYKEIENG